MFTITSDYCRRTDRRTRYSITLAALKDERGEIISEFFFSNNNEGISTLVKTASYYGKCTAVLESTANMWIRIHDTLEENGIDTILANPYKIKIIAEVYHIGQAIVTKT
ncbi:MAG TPA: transposase [Candidatus Bathyarchaeia archaeon]|nr:transposase [Candidatus Bathyarchaeia archaeon]